MTGKFYPFTALISVYHQDNLPCLKEAFDSVLAQTARPSEIIFIADGPLPEQTMDYLKSLEQKHPQIKNIFLPQNIGLGKALTTALPGCSNKLVARVDADDINLPRRFELLLAAFSQDPDLAICGGQITEIDFKTKAPVASRKVPLTNEEIRRYLKYRSPFNHVTVMFKKDAVMQAGGYRAAHLMEDYDLWLRMAAANMKMANLPDILVEARVDANMYARRGGWKYFKANKAMQDNLLRCGMISYPVYIFNVCVRFCVQVLMPNSLRGLFYKKLLRGN